MFNRKNILRAISLCVSFLLIFTAFSFAANAETGTKQYVIDSPYLDVDWDSWDAYKTQLHCHTIASDGNVQLDKVVEEHFRLGFDALSVTDHAIVGKSWTEVPQTVPLFRLVKYERTKMSAVTPLSKERYDAITSGSGRESGRPMLEITSGNEMNGAVPANSHVNGFFADYGQGLMGVDGDYESVIADNARLGGITFIDHPGTYTLAEEKDDPSISAKPEIVNKFANIFLNYPSCVGIDVNSGKNSETKYDDILYDNIIQKTIPHGVLPWLFTFSDAHEMEQWDRAFTMHVMPSLNNEEIRNSMENGTFFGISRHARVILGEDFSGEGPVPMVSKVSVDQDENIIALTVNEYTENIVWVANGKEIATGASIDINDYEDEITSYVRAYLTGPGGICYTQPFTVIEEGTELIKEIIPATNDRSQIMRKIVDFIDWRILRNNPVIELFKKYALGLTQEQIDKYYEIHFGL